MDQKLEDVTIDQVVYVHIPVNRYGICAAVMVVIWRVVIV